jgi:zinc-ribbon domain
MNCSVCGKPLSTGVTYCPNCGTPTSDFYSSSGGPPNAPTAMPSNDSPPPPPPYTAYGNQPYGPVPTDPYETPSSIPYNPYTANTATPTLPPSMSPSPPQRRGPPIGLIVGVVILVLILVIGGLVALLLRPGNATGTSHATATVSISPAQITATSQAQASATAQAGLTATAVANATATASVIAANPNPYPPGGGKLAMLDPLSNNGLGFEWDVANGSNGACTFTAGVYQVSTPKTQFYYFCASNSTTYNNFAFEAQMKILKGDCGGLIFRGDFNTGKLYLFEICQDGSYNLFIYRDFNGTSTLLANGTSAAIKPGLNNSNTLAVTAQGTTLAAYVNKQKVASVTDGSYSQGSIALVTDAYNNPTQLAFSNARLWRL